MQLPKWLKRKTRTKKEKRNLTRFKNAAFDYGKFVRKYYMEKGNAYITAHVDSIKDIVSSYSVRDYEWINPDFVAFCEECAYYIPAEDAIILEISGPAFTESEQEIITRVIQNCFGLKLGDKMILLNDNKREAIIMLVAALLFLGLFVLVSTLFEIAIIREVILIISWFFVWGCADLLFVQRAELMREKLYAGQLCVMKIKFLEEECERPTIAQESDDDIYLEGIK